MKFYIFTTWEIIYKKVITFLVAGTTIWSIYWYLNLKDKSDTFIVSNSYALFLFVIGIYINTMDKKINDKYYDRKEYYLSLIKLNSVFKTMDLESYSEDEIFRSIIHFQGFTSRSEGLKKYASFIPIKGFKFKDKELNVENEFIEKRSDLLDKLQKNIMGYIEKNSIEKKNNYPHIHNVLFDVTGWCSENLDLKDNELKNIEDYIYNLFSELQNEINELDLMLRKIIKLYSSYREKTECNMKLISKLYGKRLTDEIDKEDQFMYEIRLVRTLVERIGNNMCKDTDLSHEINDLKEDIRSLYEEIGAVKNDLSNEIETAKFELLEED